MDFNDTPDEAAFRAEVRGWLDQNAERRADIDNDVAGSGMLGRDEPGALAAFIAKAKAWQATKFEAGFAAITQPAAYGGRDGTAMQQLIYHQEERDYDVNTDLFGIGLEICLPAVQAFATPEQRERYVARAFRGDEVWCQLFSEPAAGSDLAGVRTTAIRDGDEWIVNGQKIWTSGAHYCDFGILLARTNPQVPKHAGLTMFIVDLRKKGVEVRPVRQFSGRAEFNEVFFDDVRLSDNDRLGPIDGGWKVALTTLMFERNSVGGGLGFVDYPHIIDFARRAQIGGRTALADGRVRERIADMYVNSRALELLGYRAQTALSKGGTPGPEQAITKAVSAIQGQYASYLAMDMLGEEGMLMPSELGKQWGVVEWSWTWGAAMRIAGGSDEILRNIIAERVLGLPGDIRVDKDIAYADIA